MHFQSIRFKTSVLYSTILAAILIIFSTVIFFGARKVLYQDLDGELRVKAAEIANILNAYEQLKRNERAPLEHVLDLLRSDNDIPTTRMIINDIWRSKLEIFNLKNDYINILNIRGRILLNSNNLTEDIEPIFKAHFPFSLKETRYQTLLTPQYKIRVINLPVLYRNKQLIVQVGSPLTHISNVLNSLLLFMGVTVVALLVLTSFMGSFFIKNALDPVKQVARVANKITHKDLSVRVEAQHLDEEMKYLANSFNVMINRLENSFNHISDFSSHVAHELKTPLAIMRGEVELSLDDEQSPEEYKRVLYNCLEEIDRMTRVIKDLLFLAKLDFKPEILKFEKIDLVSFLREVYQQSKILADPKNISVHFSSPVDRMLVSADKVHLRRLFLNIINNAVTYTPNGGRIDINMEKQKKYCRIHVKDTGEGISQENLKNVFNKFFRSHQTKEKDKYEAGTGLGLNIALSIAKAHRGNISVESQLKEGTTFFVDLPIIEK